MSFEITDKVAIVTGGASGIGKSLVNAFLQNGAKGVTIADINEELGEKVTKEFNEKYGTDKVIFCKTNVANSESFENAFKATVDKFKYIDILCNNAGMVDEKNWETCIDVNLKGVIHGTYLATEKYFKNHKQGHEGVVLNTSSIAATMPTISFVAYSASKFGINGFTKWYELPNVYKRFKTRVIAMCPGNTKTPIFENPDKFTRTEEDLTDFLKILEHYAPVIQSSDHVAVESIKLIQKAPSGSIWIIEDSKPAYEFIALGPSTMKNILK